MPGLIAGCPHSRSEQVPRYLTATPQSLPICRSSVTFQFCTRGELMSGSMVPKAPKGTNGVSRFVTIGWGSPPTCAYGSSMRPGGSVMSDRLPNGGADELMLG